MMPPMSEGSGQQPAQEPRSRGIQPSGTSREVLEGLVIPSGREPADPRQVFAQAPEGVDAYSVRPGTPGTWAGPPQALAAAPGQGGDAPKQQPPGQPGPQGGAGAQGGPSGGPQGGPQVPPQGGPQQGGYGFPQGPQGPNSSQQPGGYGYPQQAAPQGGGYGYPPQQPSAPAAASRPAEPAGGGPGTPDWNALAEQQESGKRRRKVLMLVGGAVAVAVIAGGVATAVVVSGSSSDKTVANPTGSQSAGSTQPLPPQPSFSSVAPPPPVDPRDFISSAAKDTAPITADSLFPGKQFVWQGRTYVKTNSTSTKQCSAAAAAQLAPALAAQGCTQMVRATYTNGDMAVTVGIAVFADKDHAAKVHSTAKYVLPLNGGGVADFCHAVACQMTSNSVGRYAYFAIAGYRNGKTLPQNDTLGLRAADDASSFAFARIVQRGRDAAAKQ
jgi:hypothetical protein